MNRLHSTLIAEYADNLGGPLCSLSQASARFARLVRLGRKSQATVAWAEVLLRATLVWHVLREWRGIVAVEDLPYTASRRALVQAVEDLHSLPWGVSEVAYQAAHERLRVAVMGEGR